MARLKILLVNPPAPTVPSDTYDVPLGLAYIAATLLDSGHAVRALDCGRMSRARSEGELNSALVSFRPDVVGATSVSATYEAARDLLSRAKQTCPEVLTIHGGIHVSTVPQAAMSDANPADVFVIGEGEVTMVDLLQRVSAQRDLAGTRGTFVKTSQGYVAGLPRPLIADLDQLPLPARGLFDTASIPVMRVITSRGCPYDCVFCASGAFWQRRIRYHAPERVAKEVRTVVDSYKMRKILIVDDTFTANKQRVYSIINKLEGIDAEYSCLSRVDCITQPLLREMSKAGFRSISLGCESGSDQVLETTRKKITTKQIREAIRAAKQQGLRVRTSWMWGLPADSAESLAATVRLIVEEEPDEVVFYRFVPYPGTSVYKDNPYLHHISPSQFHSGTNRFIHTVCELTVGEMENLFGHSVLQLQSAGYDVDGDSATGCKTVTTGFSKFTSFWSDSAP